MGRKVPFPQSKEEAGVLRRELAVRAYSPRPEPPVLRVGATHRELVDEIELAKSEQKVLKIILKNDRDGKNNTIW